ncbi:phosphotransferase family protein [Paenibacillus kobensis]|uniref:phosphotransferase family protein n=1 Tax=Paenibacillus kobensis TaxID=59841 RepID=UPI000FDB19DE|nr:aminoglycoside phosphotransferase family protein [Paenibacillus kobensis]
MNQKLGNKIGEGGCAEVFEWEDGSKAVKLAKPNTNAYAIRRELSNTRIAWEIGLPVPKPYEFIEVDGRPGAVFERIAGESLMQSFMRMLMQKDRPQAGSGEPAFSDEVIAQTVKLLHRIHAVTAADMPSQREDIEDGIRRQRYLNEEETESVIAMLERLPKKRQLCHGDPNPGNIIIQNGEPVIIDWNNATHGSPEGDIAEYIVMLRYGILPPELPAEAGTVFDTIREPFIERFMEQYTKLTGITYADVDLWIAPIAARKLSADGISDEEKQSLAAEVRRRIALDRLTGTSN